MRPYNFKVWATPPEMMDFHWIGERVAVPDLEGGDALDRDGAEPSVVGAQPDVPVPEAGRHGRGLGGAGPAAPRSA